MLITQLRLVLAAVVVAIATAPASPQQNASAPLSLQIAPALEQVSAGTEVRISTKLTNNSDKPVAVERTDVFPYMVMVRRADGNLVPETERGRELRKRQTLRAACQLPSLRRTAVTLNPGETESGDCAISDWYDLTAPGEYHIQLQFKWNGQVIASNTIKVRVAS